MAGFWYLDLATGIAGEAQGRPLLLINVPLSSDLMQYLAQAFLKKSPIPAKIFTQSYVSHLMLVKQSSFKTPQTLVNLSGELWPINKASHKEGHIVNVPGVRISQDVFENEAEDQK